MSDIQCSTCSTGISLLQPAVPPSVGSYSTSTLHLQCVCYSVSQWFRFSRSWRICSPSYLNTSLPFTLTMTLPSVLMWQCVYGHTMRFVMLNNKLMSWMASLCSKHTTDSVSVSEDSDDSIVSDWRSTVMMWAFCLSSPHVCVVNVMNCVYKHFLCQLFAYIFGDVTAIMQS